MKVLLIKFHLKGEKITFSRRKTKKNIIKQAGIFLAAHKKEINNSEIEIKIVYDAIGDDGTTLNNYGIYKSFQAANQAFKAFIELNEESYE